MHRQLEQFFFERARDSRLASAGKSGQPNDSAAVLIAPSATFGGDLALTPEDVVALDRVRCRITSV